MSKTREKPFTNWDSVPLIFGSDICAIVLGIPVSSIQRMAKEGKLPAHKVDKNYKYDKQEIKDWFLSRQETKGKK